MVRLCAVCELLERFNWTEVVHSGQDTRTPQQTASTFYSIHANDGLPDWVELDMIVKEWNPNLFVVGDPLNMDGTRSKIQDSSDKFSTALNKRYDIGIEKTDERLSSREAKERLENIQMGIKDSRNKHSISAQIILEDWFRSKY